MNVAELFVRVTGDTSDVTAKLAGAQRSLDSFGAASNRASQAAEGHKLSLGRVERALASYVGHAAGANAVTESLSVAFGSFAVGGGIVAGVLLGIGAIVAIYEKLTEAAREAAKAQAGLTKSLADRFKPKTGVGSDVNTEFEAARAQQADANAQLKKLLRAQREGGGGIVDLRPAIEEQTERLRQANEAIGRAAARGTTPLSPVSVTGESAAAMDAALQKRIDILTKGIIFDNTRAKVTGELVGLEHQLRSAMNDGNLALDKRIAASLRLGQVMDALAQKFGTPSTTANTSLASLIGITGNGETAVSRALTAYGQPMPNVEMKGPSSVGGITHREGQADLIGAQQEIHVKELTAAEKNAKETQQVIWGAAMQSANAIVGALNVGGGGKGSQLGGALGSTAGFVIGTPGGPIGQAIGSTVGNVAGSFIGGLFDHKKAVDRNTQAINGLTAALFNIPQGYKLAGPRYRADEGRSIYDAAAAEAYRRKLRGGLAA